MATALSATLIAVPAYATTTTINAFTLSTVTLLAGDSLDVTAAGTIFTTVDNSVIVSGAANTITNDGLIQAGTLGSTIVISGATSDLTGGIINSGNIFNTGGFSVIRVTSGDISGGITNNGDTTISSNDTVLGTIGFDSGANMTGDIINSGGISNSAGSAIFLVDGSSGSLTFNDGSGTIGVSFVSGVNARSTVDVGGLGFSGGITINEGATITHVGVNNAFNFDSLTAVTPITINGGTIDGNFIDTAPTNGRTPVTFGGNFSTNGDFVVSSLTVNPSGNLTISGGNTFTTSQATTFNGTLTFGIDATGNAGRLIVNNGNTIDLTGATIEVDVDAAASLTANQELNVGSGSSAIIGIAGTSGQILTTVTDNSALFDFAIADGSQVEITGSSSNDELFLLVSQVATVNNTASTPNTQSAAVILDGLSGSSDASISAILGSLGAASTIKDVVEGLEMWGQFFGQTLNQGTRGGIDGFNADTFGFAFGIDTEKLYDDAVLGVAIAYANTDIDSENANRTQTDIENYQIALYGDYDLDRTTFISGAICYTFGNNDGARFDVGGVSGLTANADFDSDQFSAQVEVGRDYQFKELENVIFTPNVNAYYLYYSADDYVETGAGGANLSVNNESIESFELGLGVDIRRDYVLNNGGRFIPEARLGYRYDFLNESVQATSTFTGGGGAFSVEGFDPARHTLNFGVATRYETPHHWDLTLSYDYETKSDFNAHDGFVRASYKF